MVCPFCSERVELNWAMYLDSSFTPQYTCPSCHTVFALVPSWRVTLVLIFSVSVAALLPALLVFFHTGSFFYSILAFVLGYVVVVIPLGKWIANNRRRSVVVDFGNTDRTLL